MNHTAVFSRLFWLMAVMTTFLVPRAQANELPSLERGLRIAAGDLLKMSNERKYANVGVLKFRIKKGAGKLTNNAGLLNLKLAEKLEIDLILANNLRQPIGIVHDASSVAAGISGANHLSADLSQMTVAIAEAEPTTPKPPVIDLADDEAEDASIISRRLFPKGKPKSLDALKSQLVMATQDRGLIDEGATGEGKTFTVKFAADPRPIMSATLRYYRP